MKKNKNVVVIAKQREILDILETINNLNNHCRTLMRDLRYIEANS